MQMLSNLFEKPTNIGPRMSNKKNPTMVKQNPSLAANVHTNMLQIACPEQVEWYRIMNDTPQLIDNGQCQTYHVIHPSILPQVYQFSIDDIGCTIQASTSTNKISIGPIVIENRTKQTLQNIVQSGGSKFPISIESIVIYNDEERAISEMRQQWGGTLYVADNSIRLSTVRDAQFNLQYSDIVIESGVLTIQDSEIIRQFIRQLSGIKVDSFHYMQIHYSCTSRTQSDLVVLAYRLFMAKQHLLNFKAMTLLEERLSSSQLFGGSTANIKYPGDILLCIQNQANQIQAFKLRCQTLENHNKKAKAQLIQMEEEMQLTIQAYSQILDQHNINNHHQSFKTIKQSIVYDQGGLESKLKQQSILIERLRLIQDDEYPTTSQYNVKTLTKDQLMRRVEELENKWNKSKRLNELLNEELTKLNSNQLDNDSQYDDELVQEYKVQIMQLHAQIDDLKSQQQKSSQQISSQLSLQSQWQQNDQQLIHQQQQQQQQYQDHDEEVERLQEQCNALSKKNESLLKEIDMLIKSPNQIRNLQSQVAIEQLNRTNQRLEEENTNLRDQLNFLEDQIKSQKKQQDTLRSSYTQQSRNSQSPSHKNPHPIFYEMPPVPKPPKQISSSRNLPLQQAKQTSRIFGPAPTRQQSFGESSRQRSLSNHVMSEYEKIIKQH